jgi:hypothetical protein
VERARGFCQDCEFARPWEAWHPLALGFLAAIVLACAGLRHASVAAIVAGVLPGVPDVATILGASTTVAQLLPILSWVVTK